MSAGATPWYVTVPMAANQDATVVAPTIGRRAWRTLPPPSVHSVTSGAGNSIRALTTPPVAALKNLSATSRCRDRCAVNPGPGRLDVFAGTVRRLSYRGRLDAGEPAAHNHHRAVADLVQATAQNLGILGTVQCVCIVVDAGNSCRVGRAAKPVHQSVVGQDAAVVDPYGLRPHIQRRDPTPHEPRARASQQLRDAQLGQLLPGCRHRQPQSLGELLVRVHQGHLYIAAPPDPSRQLDRGGHARVTRSQNQYPVLSVHRSRSFPCAVTDTRWERAVPT